MQKLARRSVGFRRIGADPIGDPHSTADQRSQIGNGDIATQAYIDMLLARIIGEQARAGAGRGKVVEIEELAARYAGTPDLNRVGTVQFRHMRLADQGWQDVALFRMVIVAETVEIGRHRADGVAAVLAAIGVAPLDPGHLGNRVPPVRRLPRPGEQRYSWICWSAIHINATEFLRLTHPGGRHK